MKGGALPRTPPGAAPPAPPSRAWAEAQLCLVWSLLPQARLVGGAVRDRLAGLPHTDHDLATPDPPDTVIAKLAARGIKTVPTGLAHGTVTAIVDGVAFEITTLRRDVRTDGRRADTEWTDDWREDAARRDFTINAMSLDRTGTLHDHFAGAEDLAAGRVRFVGDAARRIEEDHLRILRFFRFHARFARGAPDADADAAIRPRAHLVRTLSAERVWTELKRLLAGPNAAAAIDLMASLGVLAHIIPEGADPARLHAAQSAGIPSDPVLRAALLLDGPAAAFAERLRLSNDEAERLAALRAPPAPTQAATEDELRRLLADTSPDILAGRTWFTPAPDELRARIAAIDPPRFPLAGRDAVALGAKPGPNVGDALRQVRAWWLARGARDDRDACLSELRGLLDQGAALDPLGASRESVLRTTPPDPPR